MEGGGKNVHRRSSGRARVSLLPRLALRARLGLFVFICLLVQCGNPEGPSPSYHFVYVGMVGGPGEAVHKLNAATGEKVFGFGTSLGALNVDVDARNGDVYFYTTNYLSKYSKEGKLQYRVNVDSGSLYDRMVFDKKNKTVWVLEDNDGNITGYRGADGKEIFTFATELSSADQLILDEADSALWVVGYYGYIIRKFSTQGEKLLELEGNEMLTPMALDKTNDTVIFGWYEGLQAKTMKIKRYEKNGTELQEFPVNMRHIKGLAVEPQTGIIWISDGLESQRYSTDGGFLGVLDSVGFVCSDFSYGGKLMFGIDANRRMFALRTRNLRILWTGITNAGEDNRVVKYSLE
jgi:hypothetical protein